LSDWKSLLNSCGIEEEAYAVDMEEEWSALVV
jgi:hypothetical protein